MERSTRRRPTLIPLLASFGLATLLLGAGLKDTVQWREATEGIKEYQAGYKESCGSEVGFEFDQATFTDWNWDETKVEDRCGNILKTLGYACIGSDEGKKAIQSQVKRVVCRMRPGTDPEQQELKGGSLRYSVETQRENSKDEEWLQRTIKLPSGMNLKEAEAWQRNESSLAETVKSVNSTCSSKIQLELEKKSFIGRSDDLADGSNCDGPLEVLERRCGDEAARKLVVSRIQKIRCRTADRDESGFASLTPAGELVYEVGRSRATDTIKNAEWLDATLDATLR